MQAAPIKDLGFPEFEARKVVAQEMERVARIIARGDTLHQLGFKDPEAIRKTVMQMRRNLDVAIFHYLSFGSTILPSIDPDCPPTTSWVFMFLYIVMSRGNMNKMQIHQACSGLNNDDNAVVVPRLMMEFVDNHRAWKDHRSKTLQIMQMVGLPHRSEVPFDGSDILAMANLFGFRKASVCDVDYFDGEIDKGLLDEVVEALPPMTMAEFAKKDQKRLIRAFTINRMHLTNGINQYAAIGVTQAKARDALRGYLISIGTIPPTEDGSVNDVIDTFLTYMRRTTYEAVPVKRDDELISMVKRVLGVDMGAPLGVGFESVVLRCASILAITMVPKEKVFSLH